MIPLTIRMAPHIHAKLAARAKESGRTITAEIREALLAWVKK